MLKEAFATRRIAGILDLPHEKVLMIQRQLEHETKIIELLQEGKLSAAGIANQLHVFPFLVEVIAEHKIH